MAQGIYGWGYQGIMGIPRYRDGKRALERYYGLLVNEMRKLSEYVYILNEQNTDICTLP